ncbi:MAG: DUF1285 domain-containing protein [Gammaproteobacteria bacterium]|nr:DUF1285 domain-containing protein [Gammaproteobacteria bacterium]
MQPDAPYSLLKELGKYKDKGLPPLHLWHPEESRAIDMRIDRSSKWFHEGSPINRPTMVRLFSTVLRREDDDHYYLVTPVEKCRIEVEDVPFQAILMNVHGEGEAQTICFTTNVADEVMLDSDHPLRIETDSETEEPSPYILVRDRLEARLNRSVFYQLVDAAIQREIKGETWLGVWSSGIFFKLMLLEP